MTASAPPGYHTLTPRIFADDAEGLLRFLKHVFDASGEFEGDRPAEVRIGDSLLLLSGTAYRAAFPACLYVYVEDVEATHARALDSGAESLEPPKSTPYGDWRAMFQDRWGNLWQVASRA